jgi:hypothetical protein
MAAKRDNAYVWVTSVTKLMAGEAQCQWAAWFRANHRDYKKVVSDFDLAKWTAEHTSLVEQNATTFRTSGHTVTLENQNSFKLKGKNGAVLAGKADVVASLNDTVCILDCKTGMPKHSDKIQVMIYLLVLPLVRPEFKEKVFVGRVCYKDHYVDLPAESVDDDFKTSFRRTMESLSVNTPPAKVPSFPECRFCDIDISECADRVTTAPIDANPDHDLF